MTEEETELMELACDAARALENLCGAVADWVEARLLEVDDED